MADRKLYSVTVQYRHERPIVVHFNGPACGVGRVFISFAGIDSEIVNPSRFGAFDRDYPRRFYAHAAVTPDVPDPTETKNASGGL